MTIETLLPRITAPLTPERIGIDPRYDDQYLVLKDEIAKLDSPSAGAIDWAQVERRAADVLSTLSKDLLAASYFAYARHKTQGVQGAADGLAVLDAFMTTYGDTCFPTRARARANALSWCIEALARDLASRQLASGEGEAARRALATCAALKATATAKLAADAPSFAPLSDAIARLVAADDGSPAPVVAPPQIMTLVEAPAPELAPVATSDQPTLVEAPADPTVPVASAAPDVCAVASEYLEPISADAPAGPEAKYDADYEALGHEIAKLDALTGAVPDFKRIASLADTLLRTKTKDLLVASYYGVALLELDGVAGLPLAVSLPAALLERFPTTVHPAGARPRRRANALSFLYERLARRLPELPVNHTDRGTVDALLLLARQHARTVGVNFESDGPATRTLLEAVERLSLSVPPPPAPVAPPEPAVVAVQAPVAAQPPAPEAAPTAPAASAPVAARPIDLPSAPQALADVTDLVPFLSTVGKSLVDAAVALRQADVTDPRAIRLLRTGLYMHIEAAPPHGPDGKTSIPAPPDVLFERLGKMAQHEKWNAILDETEASLGQFRFSLDLQRFSATALRGLGCDAARVALIGSLRPLLDRVPSLTELKFANGRAFADADTIRFVKNDVLGAKGGGQSAQGASEVVSEALTAARAALDEAAALGNVQAILGAASVAIEACADVRQRFQERMRVASMLADAGHPLPARLMHVALDAEIATHALDVWEPSLVLAHLVSYSALLAGLDGMQAQHESVLARVARLSPTTLSECLR